VNGAPRFAGFWLRALALLVDLLVLGFGVWLARLLAGQAFEEVLSRTVLDAKGETFARYSALHALARDFLGLGVPFVYFTLLEGVGGATLGKRILGLRVRGPEGLPIGLIRAALRNLAKPLSFACCFGGLLLAAFSARKRALHDWIAGSVVVRKEPVARG